MKIKVVDAEGPILDWLVELAKGTHWSSNGYFVFKNPDRFDKNPEWKYSTDWYQGGRIVDILIEERFEISKGEFDTGVKVLRWNTNFGEKLCVFGPTTLIAAMRCFVASRLGETVDVPDELDDQNVVRSDT